MNPYIDYYKQQAGSGLVGFEGARYQKGHGFFGRLISSFAKPLLGYLGKKALGVGKDLAGDILQGKNLRESGKRRLKQGLKAVGQDALSYGKRKLDQVGTGVKRRRIVKKQPKKTIKGRQIRKTKPKPRRKARAPTRPRQPKTKQKQRLDLYLQ